MKKEKFTFIDLFAGLGGFHLAMESLGGECVFASELKEDLRKLYKINFPQTKVIVGDITLDENINKVPSHDVLCAGFPCQPFSQAGKRQGFKDEKDRGNLFEYICKIAERHKPEIIFLENVANLKGHDNGNTWKVIYHKLHDQLGYDVSSAILSPHQFGIPQHRKRIYIVCRLQAIGGLNNFSFPLKESVKCDIKSIINEKDEDVTIIKPETRLQIDVWQEFIDNLSNHGQPIPKFPIWAMEFGADYEFEDKEPASRTKKPLIGKKGKFGKKIKGKNLSECLLQLPVYAQSKSSEKEFPDWKKRYIRENRKLYKENKAWIDLWLKKVKNFENSHLKFEWNCGEETNPSISDKIVQFRASGIRVKKRDYSPALNLVGTQIPIFPWIKTKKGMGRYMSCNEAAAIQGMQILKWGNDEFCLSRNRIFEALGNAVNVSVIKKIFQNVMGLYEEN